MKKITEFKVMLAVSYEMSRIIIVSYEKNDIFDGCPFNGPDVEDNNFTNVPDKPGIYNCRVEFWFEQGYFEGYPANGENDWEFRIISAERINVSKE